MNMKIIAILTERGATYERKKKAKGQKIMEDGQKNTRNQRTDGRLRAQNARKDD